MSKYIILLLFILLSIHAMGYDIMPLEQIKPGMTGYGLSVFHGSKIERFNIEVVDILKGFAPYGDVILVRCTPSYTGYDLSKSGLIAGMSGSPIYIEGKLIGALAYGWAKAKETIAGITPIEQMLAITKRPVETTAFSNPNNSKDTTAFNSSENLINQQNFAGLIPINTPIVIAGANLKTFTKLQQQLSQLGLMAIPGAMSSASQNYESSSFKYSNLNKTNLTGQNNKIEITSENILTPGAAIAAHLVTGDMDISAIGTVTWSNGNDILAFGHSFLNAGNIKLPISTAHISTVLMSSDISFKLGNPIAQIGTLYNDLTAGVYAKMGVKCPMIPVEIIVENTTQNRCKKFNIEIIEHPFATMVLAGEAIENFISLEEPILNEHTIQFTAEVWLDEKPSPFIWKSQSAGLISIGVNFTEPLASLIQNSFQRSKINKIKYSIQISPRMQLANIISVKTENYEVSPGETINLVVEIQPYFGKVESMNINFTIPENAMLGAQTIIIGSGEKIKLGQFNAETNEQYLQFLQDNNKFQAQHLLVILPLPNVKILCEEQNLSNLPWSVVSNLLTPNTNKNIQLALDFHTVETSTPYLLQNVMQFVINIQKKDSSSQSEE